MKVSAGLALSLSKGFTLVELLVVIAIMAIIGAFALVNYGSFGEDQNLKNAVLDLQSLFRTAQTNATTNVICSTQYYALWQIYASATSFYLGCQEPSGFQDLKKTLKINAQDANIKIDSVSGTGASCPTSASSLLIKFAPVKGSVDLGANCTLVLIKLKNTKTSSTKSLTIEQGGRIYAQ